MTVEFRILCNECQELIAKGSTYKALEESLSLYYEWYKVFTPINNFEDVARIGQIRCKQCLYKITDEDMVSETSSKFMADVSLSNDIDDYFMD